MTERRKLQLAVQQLHTAVCQSNVITFLRSVSSLFFLKAILTWSLSAFLFPPCSMRSTLVSVHLLPVASSGLQTAKLSYLGAQIISSPQTVTV